MQNYHQITRYFFVVPGVASSNLVSHPLKPIGRGAGPLGRLPTGIPGICWPRYHARRTSESASQKQSRSGGVSRIRKDRAAVQCRVSAPLDLDVL